ncbi:MAG: MoaD/ThiS family protein [Anaerolineales bacterium]
MTEDTLAVHVEVRVFATLRRYLAELDIGEPKLLEVPQGTTLGEIREQLGLPTEEVKVIMRNNRQADEEDLAQEGDRITYIPAVAGG